METALEVLSRAATMVTANSDNRLTITKELPTTKWRRDRRIRLSSEYHHNHETISIVKPLGESNQSNQSMNNGSSDTMEIPLDMTVMENKQQKQSVESLKITKQQQLPPPPYREPLPGSTFSTITRPSVITQAPKREIISNQENKESLSPKKSLVMCDDLAPAAESISMVDPVIDEHFRRSLGADYMNLFGNHLNQLKSARSAATNQTTSNNNNNNNKINNKSPQISPIESKIATKPVIPVISNKTSTENDKSEIGTENGPATGTVENIEFSVDDHFAKALGDTWKQLQQNKQTNGSPADSPSPNNMEIDEMAITASANENDDFDDDVDDDDDGASDSNNSDSHR